MIRHMVGLASVLALAALVGCTSEKTNGTAAAAGKPSEEGARYLLSVAPEEPLDVIPMREAVDDEQEVVVVGRIGGSQHPWVDGLAAFSLVDRSLSACTDVPGDNCPTPWDYCCVTDRLPGSTTLVKVVDDQGNVVGTGAQELLGLAELQTVVVKGKAHKDDAGNVTLLAEGIYVDPTNPGQVPRSDADVLHESKHAHDHDHPHDHAHDHDGDGHDHDAEHNDDHDHAHEHETGTTTKDAPAPAYSK